MRKQIDISGKRFGALVAIEPVPGASKWRCLCDCGAEKVIASWSMRSGKTRTCGCFLRKTRHIHGMADTPTYSSWKGMRARCSNPESQYYHRYGGRGIKVCERWNSFDNFLADMGERPDGMSIDRYPNNDGNYEPGNCRWATDEEQAANRSTNRIVSAFGKEMCIAEWARETGLRKDTITNRLDKQGLSPEAALTIPRRQGYRPHWALSNRISPK